MWDILTSSEMFPFSLAISLVAGLVLLELIALLVGGSVLGVEADGPDLDAGFDFDAELDAEAALGEVEGDAGAAGAGGALSWLGIGDAPFILWFAGVATCFGVSGYVLQTVFANALGGMAPAGIAALLAAAPGILGGKYIARMMARIAPKTESTAVSRRHLGGRLGVITQGTAAQGRPAEARVKNRHGDTLYIRVEPREAGVEIPQGTDVIVFAPKGGVYPVIAFGDD